MIYLTLIFEFFKIGLFAAGGGLATLPFLTALADKYPWLTSDMLSQMVAISESTPGPLGVNMATYAGYMAGLGTFAGSRFAPLLAATTAFTATASLVAPSFIIILIVSRMLDRYKNSKLVANAFSGLRPAVAGLIAAACWSVLKISIFDLSKLESGFFNIFLWPELGLFVLLLVLTNLKKLKKLHPLCFIAFAAAAGIGMGYAFGW